VNLRGTGTRGGTVKIEIPTGTPSVVEIFREGVATGSAAWTHLSSNDGWRRLDHAGPDGGDAWRVANTEIAVEASLVLSLPVPIPPSTSLRFIHRYDTENVRDGGVLEYSVDGGNRWEDAGPLLVEGEYNSSIAIGESSPLAGRQVWSGDSGGWTSVRADLSSLAGSELRLRWRFATNFYVADDGWYVDDVVVDTTGYLCTPLSAVPGEVADPAGAGSAFRIGKHPDGYELNWSAPASGGAAMSYALYRTPLGAPVSGPQCEANLGHAAPATLSSLATGSAFIVVGRNSLGEGSYGRDSADQERTPAQGASVCP